MALTFAAKQDEHMRSIRALCQAQQFADTMTIARVMLEGMVVLLWAAQMPEIRPYNWRTYALVVDFGLAEELAAAGVELPEGFQAELLERVQRNALHFLKHALATPAGAGSFKPKWHIDDAGKTVTMRAMLDELNASELYKVYSDFSNWIHWNARGIAHGLSQEEESIRIRWLDASLALPSLAVGFQALAQSLKALDSHLSLGHGAALNAVVADYIRTRGAG